MTTKSKRGTPAAKAPVEQKPIEKVTPTEVALAFGKECLGWKDAKTEEFHPEKKIYHFEKNEG
jgi:hypothetical protein